MSPAPVPPAAFALDAERIAYASFRRHADGLAPRELESVPLRPGIFAGGPLGGPLADAAGFDAALAALCERLSAAPRKASLVLPDSWARALVVELGSLPERPGLRLEVLRYRLKKLVPFRVDELRIAASAIAPLEGQEDPVRALVTIASEPLCTAVERAFAARGIRIGQITNSTLARLEALAAAGRAEGLIALASVERDGLGVVFARDGEPVLWRQKSFTEGLGEQEQAAMLAAELRLTKTFLEERLPGASLSLVFLETGANDAAHWRAILSEGLERPIVALDVSHLPLAGEVPDAPAGELASLAGGVSREVA